jgi:1-phosphatidylinositol-3-phosphate 5-kinase
MAVAKIVAQKPNLLLVENSVSRYAQDLLLEKNISLVLNIKQSLLQRISRCTGAQIVPSIDLLPSQKLGYCELFHVDKYDEHSVNSGNVAKKMVKTMMFFEGCPKPLGCTVSDAHLICSFPFSFGIDEHQIMSHWVFLTTPYSLDCA